MNSLHAQSLDVDGGDDELSNIGSKLHEWQVGVNWWIGDLVLIAKRQLGDDWMQVFPETMSPGLIQRCEGVAAAFPAQDRNPKCTWTQHAQVAKHADRVQRLATIADQGLTSDESRKTNGTRWLLAVDTNYFVHRFWHSGAGVAAADEVAKWIGRTAERLSAKGLTDVVCCFDSATSFRKELTKDWEKRYKDRPPKDPELGRQIQLAVDLCHAQGFCCCAVDDMEADDVIASYATQFSGRVTILSQDKDLKQCLSPTCNMLLDVEWTEDPTTGDMIPKYRWLSASDHTEQTGIRPDQWTDYQCIMGDATDGIAGAAGIGAKGAADLIQEYGTLNAVLDAALNKDDRLSEKRRNALRELGTVISTVRQLVTMRTDLSVRTDTTIVQPFGALRSDNA